MVHGTLSLLNVLCVLSVVFFFWLFLWLVSRTNGMLLERKCNSVESFRQGRRGRGGCGRGGVSGSSVDYNWLRHVISSWENARNNLSDLHTVMGMFNMSVNSDEYSNYCALYSVFGRCCDASHLERGECVEECQNASCARGVPSSSGESSGSVSGSVEREREWERYVGRSICVKDPRVSNNVTDCSLYDDNKDSCLRRNGDCVSLSGNQISRSLLDYLSNLFGSSKEGTLKLAKLSNESDLFEEVPEVVLGDGEMHIL